MFPILFLIAIDWVMRTTMPDFQKCLRKHKHWTVNDWKIGFVALGWQYLYTK